MITIAGAGFGIKQPAAPLLWDDCETKAVDNDLAVLSSTAMNGGTGFYSGVAPFLTADGGSACQENYRTRYRLAGFRGKSPPHKRSAKFLSGGHYDGGCDGYGYTPGAFMDVGVVIDSGTADKSHWFATWYYGLDPKWDIPPVNDGAANHKMDCIQYGTSVYGGGGDYTVFDNNPAKVQGMDTLQVSNQRFQYPESSYHMNRYAIGNNPLDHGWVRWERRNRSDDTLGVLDIFLDNELLTTLKNVDNNHAGYCDNTRAFLIGGYYRWQYNINATATYHGGNNCFRYFDDIYVDTTWSRIMLANSATYEEATIVEPQIPVKWNSGSITFKVNLGRLPEAEVVFLFVFDAANTHNQEGFRVKIADESDIVILSPPISLDITGKISDDSAYND